MGVDIKAASAFALNIASAVCIIFLNKALMGSFKFRFATTLSAFHFICSAITVQLTQCCQTKTQADKDERKATWVDIAMFVLVSCVSLISLNLSLLINTVGFYQIAKLLVTPFVCAIEAVFLGRKFSPVLVSAITMVVIGVGIVTVTDISMNPLGVFIAMLSVAGSGLQQVLCRDLQTRLNMQSNELLMKSAWPQGVIMLSIGPFLDRLISKRWVNEFEYTDTVVGLILATCGIAILVNISQFMTLKGFSAVAYSVMGHMKTILVLFGGMYFFNEIVTVKKGLGMIMAIMGMVTYGYVNIKEKQQQQQASGTEEDKEEIVIPLKSDVEKGVSKENSISNTNNEFFKKSQNQ
eukprot:TRINITY_DN763_c3_g1_i1.p2 TRINITY_DN763_c3_g1~~TRINITY_DN763_c3_g1_i1.p2  ORF type:complete len:351 (-),score=37.98 TRINITY_DN763_c3_g1_i1:613-1665(-)